MQFMNEFSLLDSHNKRTISEFVDSLDNFTICDSGDPWIRVEQHNMVLYLADMKALLYVARFYNHRKEFFDSINTVATLNTDDLKQRYCEWQDVQKPKLTDNERKALSVFFASFDDSVMTFGEIVNGLVLDAERTIHDCAIKPYAFIDYPDYMVSLTNAMKKTLRILNEKQ